MIISLRIDDIHHFTTLLIVSDGGDHQVNPALLQKLHPCLSIGQLVLFVHMAVRQYVIPVYPIETWLDGWEILKRLGHGSSMRVRRTGR